MSVLAGDIGGTKTVLAVFDDAGGETEARRREVFASGDFETFDALLDAFGPPGGELRAAAFGVAGPVLGGVCDVTNLPWTLREADLGARLGAGVRLLNDLAANAHGIAELGPAQLETLPGAADAPPGTAALLSAGTGLGQSWLPMIDGRHHPQPSEAGHADFAPRDALDRDLAAFLAARFGRGTWEHVLSGPGLGNLYDFHLARAGAEPHPEVAAARAGTGDANARVAALADGGGNPCAEAAVDHFVRLLGSECGNLALRCLARGGVYLGGGIAPKMLGRLRGAGFAEAFRDKAPFRDLLEAIPVRVILDSDCALKGAARVARGLGG